MTKWHESHQSACRNCFPIDTPSSAIKKACIRRRSNIEKLYITWYLCNLDEFSATMRILLETSSPERQGGTWKLFFISTVYVLLNRQLNSSSGIRKEKTGWVTLTGSCCAGRRYTYTHTHYGCVYIYSLNDCAYVRPESYSHLRWPFLSPGALLQATLFSV